MSKIAEFKKIKPKVRKEKRDKNVFDEICLV